VFSVAQRLHADGRLIANAKLARRNMTSNRLGLTIGRATCGGSITVVPRRTVGSPFTKIQHRRRPGSAYFVHRHTKVMFPKGIDEAAHFHPIKRPARHCSSTRLPVAAMKSTKGMNNLKHPSMVIFLSMNQSERYR
jgi:hypothetical protein